MSTGPILDHFWPFAGGVLLAPVLGSAVVAAVVRWRAARRGYDVEEWWSLAGVVLVLFVSMPVCGGLILGWLRGIPPGIGVAGTLLFLVAAYAGPVLVGAFLFGRFLAGRLSPREQGDDATSSGRVARAASTRVVAESGLWFVCVHLALFPALFALAIAAS